MEVVGVVGDAKYDDLGESPPPTFYTPFLQLRKPDSSVWFVARTRGPTAAMLLAVRDLLRGIDPALLPQSMSTQFESINSYAIQERMLATAASVLGALALVVSAIGIFGLMSYNVSRPLARSASVWRWASIGRISARLRGIANQGRSII